jgi:hypothetical protein
MWLLTLQLFKNSIDTQEKLRLNLHSLSVSVSELLEYGRYSEDFRLLTLFLRYFSLFAVQISGIYVTNNTDLK